MTRPAINEPTPLHPTYIGKALEQSQATFQMEKESCITCTAVPRSHQRQANMIESLRPILLEIGPAMIEPTTEPAPEQNRWHLESSLRAC